MASTAIGVAGEDARTITFMSREHKEFYLERRISQSIGILSWNRQRYTKAR